MAVKIKLMRLGKIRQPYYRVVVADARTRRSGRAIETIGKYHPKLEPSLIEIDSERAQYWLGVGAQPTEPVQHLLEITGDWQKFKGLPGAEGTLKPQPTKPDKLERVQRGAGRGGRGADHRGHHAAEAGRPSSEGRGRPRAAGTSTTRPPSREARPHPFCGGIVSAVLADALEHLVRGIVDHPDEVRVDLVTTRRGRTLEVRVHPEDLGKVIGRGGRTATALRTVVGGIGGRGVRVDVVDTDR